MKKQELKKMLMPIITECVKEMFFEKGFLSNMIQEVLGATDIINEKKDYSRHINQPVKANFVPSDTSGYDSVNEKFKSPRPTKKASGEYKKFGAFKDVDPSNPGVEIDSLLENMNFNIIREKD